jgi:hypothetical protein
VFIDCIDMGDANLGNSRIQGLQNLSVASTVLQFYGMSNGVVQMVNGIQNALNNPNDTYINVLRIWGHGGPGSQNVTAGASGSSTDDFSGIDQTTFTLLNPLQGSFAPGGWVELRGCSVGSGAAGQVLLMDSPTCLTSPSMPARRCSIPSIGTRRWRSLIQAPASARRRDRC